MLKPDRLMADVAAFEFYRQYPAWYRQVEAVGFAQGFVDHAKARTAAQVFTQVDAVAENVGGARSDGVGDTGCIGGGKERSADLGSSGFDAAVDLDGLLGGNETPALANNGDPHGRATVYFDVAVSVLEAVHHTDIIDFRGDRAPGLELQQALADAV